MIWRKYTAIFAALVFLFAPAAALASSQGPNSGTVFANDGTGGFSGATWSNPGNAAALDSVYAQANLDGDVNTDSQALKATGFGFTLPGCTAVSGITLQFARQSSNVSRHIHDGAVFVTNGAVFSSDNKSVQADWPATTAYNTYGSSSDLWGRTWACSDITAAGFGVEIAATINCIAPCLASARIDHIKITVEYSTTSSSDNPSGARRRGATIFRSETRGG